MAADVLVKLAAVLILAVVAGIAVDECTASCVRFQDFDQDRMEKDDGKRQRKGADLLIAVIRGLSLSSRVLKRSGDGEIQSL